MKKKLVASSIFASALLSGVGPATAGAETAEQKQTILHFLLDNPDVGVMILTLGIFGLVGAYALAPAPPQ